MSDNLLAVEDLSVVFHTYAGKVHAVNGMTFQVRRNEIFGLVGESGCGKSVTGMALVKMIPAGGEITAGRIDFDGQDILKMPPKELRQVRGRRIAMIFQDPSTSLNPVFSVGNQTVRIISQHMKISPEQARRRTLEMYAAVALPDPERIFRNYPHQLSGGMQQRVMIAMALACGAELLIADEPTTALDVTIQAQILELLTDLRREQNISILLITHNLGVVAETCDRVGVAYAGAIVEMGKTNDVLFNTKHPYSEGLLAALPRPSTRKRALQSIPGNVPDGMAPILGCPFSSRCSHTMEVCLSVTPELRAPEKAQADHFVACHLYDTEVER
jgi:oligopeptide/dipeptide ABC transporter ATP-binding protein